jgi:hypothetical protein
MGVLAAQPHRERTCRDRRRRILAGLGSDAHPAGARGRSKAPRALRPASPPIHRSLYSQDLGRDRGPTGCRCLRYVTNCCQCRSCVAIGHDSRGAIVRRALHKIHYRTLRSRPIGPGLPTVDQPGPPPGRPTPPRRPNRLPAAADRRPPPKRERYRRPPTAAEGGDPHAMEPSSVVIAPALFFLKILEEKVNAVYITPIFEVEIAVC